jgi:glycosyltransferase involved in cell wall biosynthesis
MNILFVSSAGHFGGTERWTAMAVKALETRGHSVWVCCPDLPHASQFADPSRLVHEVPRSIFDTPGNAKLAAILDSLNIDVVIPVSQRMYFICGRLARRLDISMVLRLGIVRLPWRPVIDWFGYGIWPDAIIVNTTSIKRLLAFAPFVKRDKIHVIYNGIDQPAPVARARHDSRFTITFVGTVSSRKGVGHLISAIAYLPAEAFSNIHLQIIGTGHSLERYRARVEKLKLDDQVSFCGHLERPADVLQNSDLFVLLSSQEGISNSLLEAMNLGIPCYTTLVGGHGEFIQDKVNAYVAKSRSPKSVARDIDAIMNDADRVQIGLRGQQTAREKFASLAMGDALERLLEKMVSGRKMKPTGKSS